MEPSPEQKNALVRSGLGDLLKNAEPMKSIGIDSPYTVPVIHYEILFSLYSTHVWLRQTNESEISGKSDREFGGGLFCR